MLDALSGGGDLEDYSEDLYWTICGLEMLIDVIGDVFNVGGFYNDKAMSENLVLFGQPTHTE